jgi:cell division protein FtsB
MEMELLLLVALVLLAVLEVKRRGAAKRIKALSDTLDQRNQELDRRCQEVERLEATSTSLRGQIAELKDAATRDRKRIALLEDARVELLSKVAALAKYQGCVDAEQEAITIAARAS